MRYEGCSSDTAVVVNRRRPSRRREICRSFTCISPWFIFCRWLNDGKSRASRTESDERNWGKEKIGGVVDVQTNVGSVSSSSKEVFSISEIGKEDSFNHGGGFGLIFLVRHELNKMVELQKRMESLPLNSQTEVDNQDQKHLSVPSKSSISSSLAKSCVQDLFND